MLELCCSALPWAGSARAEAWGSGRSAACAQVEGKQPLLTPEDCLLAEEIVKADPEVAALLRDDYGITDLSLVACDPWSGERGSAINSCMHALTNRRHV